MSRYVQIFGRRSSGERLRALKVDVPVTVIGLDMSGHLSVGRVVGVVDGGLE